MTLSFATVNMAGLTRNRDIFRTGCTFEADAASKSFSVSVGATTVTGSILFGKDPCATLTTKNYPKY